MICVTSGAFIKNLAIGLTGCLPCQSNSEISLRLLLLIHCCHCRRRLWAFFFPSWLFNGRVPWLRLFLLLLLWLLLSVRWERRGRNYRRSEEWLTVLIGVQLHEKGFPELDQLREWELVMVFQPRFKVRKENAAKGKSLRSGLMMAKGVRVE